MKEYSGGKVGRLMIGILVSGIFIFSALVAYGADTAKDISGWTFKILSLTFFEPHRKATELITQQLNSIGIKTEAIPMDGATFYTKIYDSRDFDAYVMSPVPLEASPDRHLSWLNSNLDIIPGSSGTNHGGFRNAVFDKLLNEYRAKGKSEGLRDFKKMQEIVADTIPYVPTMLTQEVRIIRSEWTGYETAMPGGPFYMRNRFAPLNIHSKTGKKVFTMASGSDIRYQNPITAQDGRSYYIMNNLVYESLVALNEKNEVTPWLATEWSEQDGGKTWIFTTRDNVKWQDGKNFTARDVAFSFNYYLKNQSAEYKAYLSSIQEVRALSDNKVRFSLSKPDILFLVNLVPVTVIPEHIWFNKNPDWANDNPIGTGPFKLTEHVKDAFIRLIKNADYWQRGKPQIDEFLVKVVPSADATFLGMSSGTLDTERYGSPISLVNKARSDKNLSIVISGDIWDQHLGLNLRRAPLNDLMFRKALAHAINSDQIVKIVMSGYAEHRDLVCHPAWHGQWTNMDAKFPSYNPEKAKEILRNAGYLK